MYAIFLRNNAVLIIKFSYSILYLNHIKSAFYTFSTFFLAPCGSIVFCIGRGAGFAVGFFTAPPNKLLAIFSFAFSSGAMNFFFYLGGESTDAITTGFTILGSEEIAVGVFSVFFCYFYFLNSYSFTRSRSFRNLMSSFELDKVGT